MGFQAILVCSGISEKGTYKSSYNICFSAYIAILVMIVVHLSP